jgi:GntR family transcriptional repressor for pyruvate dehydrogenase complex
MPAEDGVRRVEDQVWELLLAMPVRPGDRIPSERDLAEKLGLSRPTIRIALSVLVGQGLLEQRMRSGTFVATVDRLELTEVRLLLEAPAAEMAAERADAAGVAKLQDLVAQAERAIADPELFGKIDARIHDQVARMANNSTLYRVTSALWARVTEARSSSRYDPLLRAHTLERLQQLVRAIADGDGPGAAAAMRCHLVEVDASHRGGVGERAQPDCTPARDDSDVQVHRGRQ